MATSILDTLRNAEFNIGDRNKLAWIVGKRQLHNAVVLLEKGYELSDVIEEILKKYENVEEVPEKAK